jgi:hypothetical protein
MPRQHLPRQPAIRAHGHAADRCGRPQFDDEPLRRFETGVSLDAQPLGRPHMFNETLLASPNR